VSEATGAPIEEPTAKRLTVVLGGGATVSAELLTPDRPKALFVYGHGAGAGMDHPFMKSSAYAFARRGIATFRYNFLYMERRAGRPDFTPVLLSTVRAAVTAAAAQLPDVPLIAGGKSMGGRMTSQAQAQDPLPAVRGLAFVGFPLHRPKQLNTERAEHLAAVRVPMLFLQGSRDEMAEIELMRGVVARFGAVASLHEVLDADHSFHVLKRSGRTDREVIEELADRLSTWLDEMS
jgi:predicted alpha/beta-hydrolase family hydrolase